MTLSGGEAEALATTRKASSFAAFIEIPLLAILLSSLFFNFPIPGEILSKLFIGSLIGACLVLIVTRRLLRR
jgi:uncharacterized membrane protein YeaQ/YmgE (transglycosylase-associated protein family)